MRFMSMVVAMSLLAGCALEGEEEIAGEQAAISGTDASDYKQGMILWRLNPSEGWHNGYAVVMPGEEATATETSLVLTTANNVPWKGSKCLPDFVIKYGKKDNTTPAATMPAPSFGVHDGFKVINIVRHGWLPLVLLQLDRPIKLYRDPSASMLYRELWPIADVEPTIEEAVQCYGYQGASPLRYANGQHAGDTADGYRFAPTGFDVVNTGDAGALCVTTIRGKRGFEHRVVGMAYQDHMMSGTNEQISLSGLVKEWLGNQVRVSTWLRPSFYQDRNSFISMTSSKCADVPSGNPADAAIQQFTCHYGDNQAWYDFGWAFGPGPATTTFVNVTSGKCLTAAAGAGGDLRQTTCDGANPDQWFAYRTATAPDRTSGAMILNPGRNLCWQATGSQIKLVSCPSGNTNIAKDLLWSVPVYNQACTP